MKKFIIIAIITIIILVGAIILLNFNNNNEDDEVVSITNKAQVVEVYDFSTNELIIKYENQEEIDNFTKKLDSDKWSLGSPDSEDSEKYLIKVYKTPTKKLFQKNDDELNEAGTITIYESGEYVSIEANGIKVDFKTNTNLENIF